MSGLGPTIGEVRSREVSRIELAQGATLDLLGMEYGVARKHCEEDDLFRSRIKIALTDPRFTAGVLQDIVRMSEQRANDAVLESDGWKETARRWRTRSLQQGGYWRRRCKELEAELDDVNERAAEAPEKIEGLEDELRDMSAQLESERGVHELTKKSMEAYRVELQALKDRMAGIGTAEALAVERDMARAKIKELQDRTRAAETEMRVARGERSIIQDKVEREQLMPAKARMRVFGSRLGLTPEWKGYEDDDKVAAEVDRRLTALQAKLKAYEDIDPGLLAD